MTQLFVIFVLCSNGSFTGTVDWKAEDIRLGMTRPIASCIIIDSFKHPMSGVDELNAELILMGDNMRKHP